MASTNSTVIAPLPTSWWARAVFVGGLVALVLMVTGALGTRFGVWSFVPGLLMLLGALVLAALGALAGVVALIIARRAQRRADRATAMIGTVLCGAVLGIVLSYALPGTKVPPIHDITTDIADPPAFSQELVAARGAKSNPLARSGKLDEIQRAGYPNLHALASPLSPAEAYQLALTVMRDLQWDIVTTRPDEGRLEATATTRWFGFKDDVVVRIRPAGNGAAGTLIDLRSVSRVGQGDAGANAKRIELFMARFKAH